MILIKSENFEKVQGACTFSIEKGAGIKVERNFKANKNVAPIPCREFHGVLCEMGGMEIIMIKQKQMKEYLTAYLFILPNLLGFLVFILIPVIFSLFLSFSDWDLFSGIKGIKFAGLENFKEMAESPIVIKSLVNNILFSLITVIFIVVLALLLALLLNKNLFGKSFLRGMFFFPYVSNIVALCIVWMALFNSQSGPINLLLKQLGIDNPPGWLTSHFWALPSIMIVTIWINVGYVMVIYLAGLQGVPGELYEAAQIDGANAFKKFYHVTLPCLSPTTFFVVIITLINSFKVFGPVNIMTHGGPGDSTHVLVYYIYITAFRHYRMGYSAAMAWVLFIIIFAITIIQWKGQKKWVNY